MAESPFNEDGSLTPEVVEAMWRLPLVQYLSLIGLPPTYAQAILIDSWLVKHNHRVVNGTIESGRASRRKRIDHVSRN